MSDISKCGTEADFEGFDGVDPNPIFVRGVCNTGQWYYDPEDDNDE